MTDLIESGIVECCVSQVGGDEDLVQDIYLRISEMVYKKGQEWIDAKRRVGYLDDYIFIMCRNRKMLNDKKASRTEELIDEWHDELDNADGIDSRLHYMNILDIVMDEIGKIPEGKILFRWLRAGSFRKLAQDIKDKTDKSISHQTLYYSYKGIIEQITDRLEKEGYEDVQDMWTRFQAV